MLTACFADSLKVALEQASQSPEFRMVWLSVRDVIGLPPKQSRRMYSETEIPAASACLASLSLSSALIRSVRRHAKRVLRLSFSFMLSSFSWECEKRSAERSESRGEAFGRMLRPSSDRCHPARKNPPRKIQRLGLGYVLKRAFSSFAFGKRSIVKTTSYASKKESCSVLDSCGQIFVSQNVVE